MHCLMYISVVLKAGVLTLLLQPAAIMPAQAEPNRSTVGIAAVPFLQIHPSAEVNMTAGAWTALPASHIAAFHVNPAQLGNFARSRNLSFQFAPGHIDWLPRFDASLIMKNRSLAAGYNLQDRFSSIPLSIGFGYMHTFLDLGLQNRRDEKGNLIGRFDAFEQYDAYAVGLHLDMSVEVALGYTLKQIESQPAKDYYAFPTAHDVGVQLSLPLTLNDFATRVSLGYTLSNLGDGVDYNGFYPLPRKQKLGYALSVAYQSSGSGNSVPWIALDVKAELRDMLIEPGDEMQQWEYQSLPGSLSFRDHLLPMRSDDYSVTIYRGLRFVLLETLEMGMGLYAGRGWPEPNRTFGLTINSGQITKSLASYHQIEWLDNISRYFELSYTWSGLDSFDDYHPLDETRYHSLTFTIRGV